MQISSSFVPAARWAWGLLRVGPLQQTFPGQPASAHRRHRDTGRTSQQPSMHIGRPMGRPHFDDPPKLRLSRPSGVDLNFALRACFMKTLRPFCEMRNAHRVTEISVPICFFRLLVQWGKLLFQIGRSLDGPTTHASANRMAGQDSGWRGRSTGGTQVPMVSSADNAFDLLDLDLDVPELVDAQPNASLNFDADDIVDDAISQLAVVFPFASEGLLRAWLKVCDLDVNRAADHVFECGGNPPPDASFVPMMLTSLEPGHPHDATSETIDSVLAAPMSPISNTQPMSRSYIDGVFSQHMQRHTNASSRGLTWVLCEGYEWHMNAKRGAGRGGARTCCTRGSWRSHLESAIGKGGLRGGARGTSPRVMAGDQTVSETRTRRLVISTGAGADGAEQGEDDPPIRPCYRPVVDPHYRAHLLTHYTAKLEHMRSIDDAWHAHAMAEARIAMMPVGDGGWQDGVERVVTPLVSDSAASPPAACSSLSRGAGCPGCPGSPERGAGWHPSPGAGSSASGSSSSPATVASTPLPPNPAAKPVAAGVVLSPKAKGKRKAID